MSMDNINMSEAEYQALYNRIKQDLYDEFLNPETATYGADVLRQKETKTFSEKEIILEEIEQLKLVMKNMRKMKNMKKLQ
jgi:predicted metal-binding transcription factor (methanogenesis marker protein 9)